jgi:hypothetical protein
MSQENEGDNAPKTSSISGFNVGLNFTYFLGKDDIKYGFEINGFKTDFQYVNGYGKLLKQEESTTELAGFIKLAAMIDKLLLNSKCTSNKEEKKFLL